MHRKIDGNRGHVQMGENGIPAGRGVKAAVYQHDAASTHRATAVTITTACTIAGRGPASRRKRHDQTKTLSTNVIGLFALDLRQNRRPTSRVQIGVSLVEPTLMSLFDLTGRTAIVTGGTRGIGLAIAKGLVAAGANVAVASRKA